jgi:hypothetical protein
VNNDSALPLTINLDLIMLEWINVYAFVNIDFRRRIASESRQQTFEAMKDDQQGQRQVLGDRWGGDEE